MTRQKWLDSLTPSNECILFDGYRNAKGYGIVNVNGNNMIASRYVLEKKLGHPLTLHALHICDTPACVNESHLYEGTNKQNMADMVARKRQNKAKGEFNGRSKLTPEQIIEIRKLRENGLYLKDIAKQFDVSFGLIQFITTRKNWSHI